MPKPANPELRYLGSLCARHPELAGLRQKSNSSCIQCSRDVTRRIGDADRRARGIVKRVPLSKEAAAEKRRCKELERSRVRRADPLYNAQQIERKKKWRAENRDRHLEVSRAYDAKQLAENIQRRLSKNLRHRIGKAMAGKTRGVSAVRDLGMSIEDFRSYIASKFQPGMTWENYGEWHLDHIKPLALFNLADTTQARVACHYTNYQPLWALDNQRKWCKPHPETWAEAHRLAREAVL